MIKRKNTYRKIYEKFNLNIFIIAPLIVITLYFASYYLLDFNLSSIVTYNYYKIEISMAIAGILLMIMGLFTSLPSTNFRKLMKQYGHDKIIYRTLFFGVLSSLFTVLFAVAEVLVGAQSILFIISITETIIASIWLYSTLMHINR